MATRTPRSSLVATESFATEVGGAVPSLLPTASDRVRSEWRARIAAEYSSAAITQHLVLWMMRAGAPPDLIDDGLAIVSDELAHSRLSHDAYIAAAGEAPPALDADILGLAESGDGLLVDILLAAVQVFCLGETVAVPLFAHLRERCIAPTARVALDRIVRDEVRHRDFGWDLLDWLLTTPHAEQATRLIHASLPTMLAIVERSYGATNTAVADDVGPSSAAIEDDRAWGLAPPREYAEILERTIGRDYAPRFSARGIDVHAAWAARPRAL